MGLLCLISSSANSRFTFRWTIARKSNNNIRSFNYCYSSSSSSCSNKLACNNHHSLSSSSSPWLMLPPSPLDEQDRGVDKMIYNFYSLAENKVISFNPSSYGGEAKEAESEQPNVIESEFVGSSHGWLALFNQLRCDLFLYDPLARRHIKLPHIHTVYVPPNRDTYAWVRKVIITCSPESQECHALMLYNEYSLAYCCPTTTTKWVGPIVSDVRYGSGLDVDAVRKYDDIVYSSKHKLLFCLAYPGLEAWDITSTSKPKLVWSDGKLLYEIENCVFRPEIYEGYFCDQHEHLVVFDDQLFLVRRDYVREIALDGSFVEDWEPGNDYPHKTVGFDVHKIDWQGRELSYMGEGSLDGMVMFVGCNHSFAVRADEYHGPKPNSIYFTDRSITPRYVDSAYGHHDIGVFDYESKTFSPCYYPIDLPSLKRIVPGPLWFTPSAHPYTAC